VQVSESGAERDTQKQPKTGRRLNTVLSRQSVHINLSLLLVWSLDPCKQFCSKCPDIYRYLLPLWHYVNLQEVLCICILNKKDAMVYSKWRKLYWHWVIVFFDESGTILPLLSLKQFIVIVLRYTVCTVSKCECWLLVIKEYCFYGMCFCVTQHVLVLAVALEEFRLKFGVVTIIQMFGTKSSQRYHLPSCVLRRL